jgi:cytochrome b561
MSPTTTAPSYGRVARSLHWAIAILIVAAIILGLICGSIGTNAADRQLAELRGSLLFWHKSFGVTVLGLAAFRIIWWSTHKRPPLPAHLPKSKRVLAKAVHGLLYVLMVGMPVAGILLSQAVGFPVSWFGLWTLPDLVQPDLTVPVMQRAAVKVSFILHERVLAYTLFAILALHVAGLLKHHFIDRDPSIWRRMAPWRKSDVDLADDGALR